MADPVAVLAVLSALSGLAAHPVCGLRGRCAHLALCAAMLGMALPGWDVLGPLGWAGLLGGIAYWVAGADQPALARLPVLCDLLAMGALAVLMPLAAGHAGVPLPVSHQHGGTGTTTASYLPQVVLVLWAGARCAIRRHRRTHSPVAVRRDPAAVITEISMAAGMLLMTR